MANSILCKECGGYYHRWEGECPHCGNIPDGSFKSNVKKIRKPESKNFSSLITSPPKQKEKQQTQTELSLR